MLVLWIGRFVGLVFILFGLLAMGSFLDTSELWIAGLAILDVLGALAYLFSLERPSHPFSRWGRLVGWLGMAAFSLVPTSLLFVPELLVVLALPGVVVGFSKREEAREA
jgi:hypothetical protein